MYLLAINKLTWLFLAFFLLSIANCEEDNECAECDINTCEPPRNCKSGLVKDGCNCCYLCGLSEGDRCDHQELNSERLGHCGENLECRMRTDLDWDDPPEALCVCIHQTPLCASDGITYDNICQLTEARYSRRDGLKAISSDPCVKPPKIRAPPQNILNKSGVFVALTCEANGWPLPDIHWIMQKDGIDNKLPGNSSRLAVQSRNGPNKDETTSWLLFLNLSNEDQGTYVCKAQNYVGADSGSANVSIKN